MKLEVFVLTAMLNPDFVKAQKELDEVVGAEALPSFDMLQCSRISTLVFVRSCDGDRSAPVVYLMQ